MTRFDHIALATRDAGRPIATLVGELGGTVLSGGHALGYRPMQVYLGDASGGMKVELLEPWNVEANDFLERFLQRHGEGPHHLTFKVDDLVAALERCRAAGLTPVGVDLSQPIWKEAFLHPREAHGTVVQLAQSSSPHKVAVEEYELARAHGSEGAPVWWPMPPPRASAVNYLRRVVMSTPSVERALTFFAGLLDGRVETVGEGWTELVWPGGGRLRLEQRGDRAAGVDRLELDGPTPRELELAGTRFIVVPADAAGRRR